jgi:hypothetical protein
MVTVLSLILYTCTPGTVLILTKNPFFFNTSVLTIFMAYNSEAVTEGEIKCFVCIMCDSELILGKKRIFLQKKQCFCQQFYNFFL